MIFAAFAFNYFLSALLRAVVATLAPEFARELQLGAGELGLLAGSYFFAFACMQLPVGWLLDRYGARQVLQTLDRDGYASAVSGSRWPAASASWCSRAY